MENNFPVIQGNFPVLKGGVASQIFFSDSWSKVEDIVVAKNANEILIQVIALMAIRSYDTIGRLLQEYLDSSLVTKEELKAIFSFIARSNAGLSANLCAQMSSKDGNPIFTIHEIRELIIAVNEHEWVRISPTRKWDIYGRMSRKEIEFPVEILREWVKYELLKLWPETAEREGKWTALLVITLYKAGDTEVVTPEAIIKYLKMLSKFSPESHGIHRLVSLLGWGAQQEERGWDLRPYEDRIAKILFSVFMGEMKRSIIYAPSNSNDLPFFFSILVEILASYEDKLFSSVVIVKLENMFRNVERNTVYNLNLFREHYTRHLKK